MDRYKGEPGGGRRRFLELAAEIPGIYVPAFLRRNLPRGRNHPFLHTQQSPRGGDDHQTAGGGHGQRGLY